MLLRTYVEALLADVLLADEVWEAWHSGDIGDETACIAWLLIAGVFSENDQSRDS